MKEKIEQILVKHDPVKLIKMGAPLDEYDSEAQMIWEQTTRHFSLEKIHDIVYHVFVVQFSGYDELTKRVVKAAKTIGKREEYFPIAQEIKDLLDKQKPQTT